MALRGPSPLVPQSCHTRRGPVRHPRFAILGPTQPCRPRPIHCNTTAYYIEGDAALCSDSAPFAVKDYLSAPVGASVTFTLTLPNAIDDLDYAIDTIRCLPLALGGDVSYSVRVDVESAYAGLQTIYSGYDLGKVYTLEANKMRQLLGQLLGTVSIYLT